MYNMVEMWESMADKLSGEAEDQLHENGHFDAALVEMAASCLIAAERVERGWDGEVFLPKS